MADKKDNEIIEKIIIDRKYTNELTPIQAILPVVMEELNKKRMKYLKEQEDKNNRRIANICKWYKMIVERRNCLL